MAGTFMIIGLGNPGRQYEKTRHNAGFMAVDRVARELNGRFKKGRGLYEICDGRLNDHMVFLAKPLTFMNNSGTAAADLVRYYQIEFTHLLVIVDEIELPLGRIRLRRSGSAGGHNGLASIIRHLNTTDFARLRIGIGTEFAKRDMVDFVLSRFSKNEQEELDAVLDKCVQAVLTFIGDGIDKAMNLYN